MVLDNISTSCRSRISEGSDPFSYPPIVWFRNHRWKSQWLIVTFYLLDTKHCIPSFPMSTVPYTLSKKFLKRPKLYNKVACSQCPSTSSTQLKSSCCLPMLSQKVARSLGHR